MLTRHVGLHDSQPIGSHDSQSQLAWLASMACMTRNARWLADCPNSDVCLGFEVNLGSQLLKGK